MGLARPGLFIAVLSALFGVSSKLDEFLVLFLRQDSGEALLSALARNFEFSSAFLQALAFSAVGLAFAAGLAAASARWRPRSSDEAFSAISRVYVTLLVPSGLTLIAVLSLLLSQSYPYGLGLGLSLALEGTFKSLLTAGLFGASLVHGLYFALASGEEESVRAPRRHRFSALLIVAAALLLFTLATPSDFYRDGAGQGNMFKYLRMAAAMAGSGTLDIDKANENPDPTLSGFLSHLPGIARRYLRESRTLFRSIGESAARGEIYRGEMKATRANRSMFRSDDGGIYYINAPGPGLLLVPAYLADRFLNRTFGARRQLLAILFWQFLGALLIYEIFLGSTEIAGRTAALVAAFASGVIVPLLFYTFQIYPELPAALFLLYAFRKLILDPHPTAAGALAAGGALAMLPWLHQKYSLAAAVLALLGAGRFVHRRVGRFAFEPGKLALLALPLLLSAYSIFLYNHALTGSLSPTATFNAVSRTSFAPEGLLAGLLGLFLDRENGLFVFAPFYLLFLAGLPAFADRYPRITKPLLLVVSSYLLVIASFPYWPGAVSTIGRYISSVLPLLVLPAALVVRRAFHDGIVAGCAIVLTAASLAVSLSFIEDLVPSWKPDLLWDRVVYSDPVRYLPDMVSEGILGSGRAHVPKVLAQLLAVSALVYWLRDRVRDHSAIPDFARGTAAGAAALLVGLVALGALLERVPGNAPEVDEPRFRDRHALDSGRELTVDGENGFEGEGVWVPGGGSTRFFIVARESLREMTLSFSNGPDENTVTVRERGSSVASLDLPGGGPHERQLLLRKPYRFDGPKGERFLYVFSVSSRGSFVPAEEDRRRLGTYVIVR